ncbi:MFS transporter, DHA1 family, multidrug resistance protein, partial [Lecanoromycetidae sp. Uapishka_2]
MSDLIREAPIGQLVRFLTKNRVLKYPEELPGFSLPETYNTMLNDNSNEKLAGSRSDSETPAASGKAEADMPELKQYTTTRSIKSGDLENATAMTRTKTREETLPFSEDRLEVEQELAIERTKTIPIVPQKTSDGNILVDWYTTDDPANPQNWSAYKKHSISAIICAYTFAVYTGSAIYTSGEGGVMKQFGVNHTDASLPLSLYVLAYGMGPLIFAPMSEIPIIGRSPVYVVTFLIFVILSIPTALVNNFAGLLVLRFLQGFFGSPCLANGGATMQDMYSLLYLPYALTVWVSAAYCGPALGPLLSGFAVTAKGWRWSLWEILWIAGPVLVIMFLFVPETSTPNILLRRAKRLRALTDDSRLRSQSEIDQKGLQPSAVFMDALIKPIEITIKDPAIAFVNVYTALVYGIYYSFFEVFPLVYPVMYGFTLGTIGVVFTCILVSCAIGVLVYCLYLTYYLIPDIMKRGLRAQEHRLVPALLASFGPPIGLFLFAWTANPKIHWIAPTIGITIYGATVFIVMQCIFVYVPLSYPQYAASLFAGNDFFRSALACGSILFARPLFINLGVGRGVSLLAGLSTMGVIGMFVLYYTGAQLRARSKFAMA